MQDNFEKEDTAEQLDLYHLLKALYSQLGQPLPPDITKEANPYKLSSHLLKFEANPIAEDILSILDLTEIPTLLEQSIAESKNHWAVFILYNVALSGNTPTLLAILKKMEQGIYSGIERAGQTGAIPLIKYIMDEVLVHNIPGINCFHFCFYNALMNKHVDLCLFLMQTFLHKHKRILLDELVKEMFNNNIEDLLNSISKEKRYNPEEGKFSIALEYNQEFHKILEFNLKLRTELETLLQKEKEPLIIDFTLKSPE